MAKRLTYSLMCAILGAALAGCTTYGEAMRAQMVPWIGQPVRTFAEVNSLVPDQVYDNPEGTRTFIYRKMLGTGATCGVTAIGKKRENYSEWVIANMATGCPPGTF